jgi:hypothetical protein
MFLSVHVFSITCANIPQDRHQVPGRADTRCRTAARGQPMGRGGHRLSRWHLRPPACPRRCTTAEQAPGGMRDRLPPGRSLHRPAGIRLRAWQPGAFPEGPGPLSPADTGPGPGSIRTAPQRAAPIAAATAKNHSMPHLLHRVRAAANAVNMRRYCAGLLEPFRKRAGWPRMAASPTRLEPWSSASFPSGDTATSSTWLVLAAVTQSRRPSQRCTPSGCVVRFHTVRAPCGTGAPHGGACRQPAEVVLIVDDDLAAA